MLTAPLPAPTETRSTVPAPTGTDDAGRPPLSRRVAVRAAVLGGVLGVAGDAYHLFVLHDRPTQATTAGYRLHGLALMAGLLLLLLAAPALARTRGRLTAVALPLLTVGTALVVGDVWAETVVLPGVVAEGAPALLGQEAGGAHLASLVAVYATFALGWTLFAVAALRDRWCPRPAAALLVVGGVLAFLPLAGSYVLLSVGVALVALLRR